MSKIQDDVMDYYEMCKTENARAMQQGMNFRLNPQYSVILLSQRSNSPYNDRIHKDGVTIEYEGHDIPKTYCKNPKVVNQPDKLPSGKITQNGKFIEAVNLYKNGAKPELVKAYEKVFPGVWSLKGYFDLIDYKVVNDGYRNVFRFILKLSDTQDVQNGNIKSFKIEHNRLIPSEVKREVWKRDEGRCVICGDTQNLHFDHELPFSKGGTSLSSKNVRLLCMKHNLQKSDKIE